MYGVNTGGFDSLESLHAYYDGVEHGVRAYAWMRDGTSYVGTTGTTLAAALEDVNTMRVGADARMKAATHERAEALRAEAERQQKDDGENTPIPQRPLTKKQQAKLDAEKAKAEGGTDTTTDEDGEPDGDEAHA